MLLCMRTRDGSGAQEPFETIVFEGDGSRALVDINDHGVLLELMDEEDRAPRQSRHPLD